MLSENLRFFLNPRLFNAPQSEFPLKLRNGAWAQKIEWRGYRTEKRCDDIFSRLDTIRECDGRTAADGYVPRYAQHRAVKNKGKYKLQGPPRSKQMQDILARKVFQQLRHSVHAVAEMSFI